MIDSIWAFTAFFAGILAGILAMRFTVASVVKDALTQWAEAEQELTEIVRSIESSCRRTETTMHHLIQQHPEKKKFLTRSDIEGNW